METLYLLADCFDTDDIVSLRDRALIFLGFAGAFRRSELVRIQAEELTFTAGDLHVDLSKNLINRSLLGELVDLAEASSVIEDVERKMIHSVFELGDTAAREVMVPRDDVVDIERHKNLKQVLSLFLRSGYSRIPVTGDNLDDIVGVLHIKDLVSRIHENAEAADTEQVDAVMRPEIQ